MKYRIYRDTQQGRLYYCGFGIPCSHDIELAHLYDHRALAISAANRFSGGWQVEEVQGVTV